MVGIMYSKVVMVTMVVDLIIVLKRDIVVVDHDTESKVLVIVIREKRLMVMIKEEIFVPVNMVAMGTTIVFGSYSREQQ